MIPLRMKIELPVWLQVIFTAFKYRNQDMVLLYDVKYDELGYPTDVQALFPTLTTIAFESLGQSMVNYAQEVQDQDNIIHEVNRLINDEPDEDDEF